MKYSAVILDLDGTLLNSDKKISARSYNSVMACHEQGMKLIFATARPPRAVKEFLPREWLDIGSFVYYNGAMTACRQLGINVHEPIHSSITAAVFDHCVSSHPDLEIGIEVQDEWFSLKEVDYSTVMNVKGNPVVKSLEELKAYDATKILITGTMNVEALREKFHTELNILVTDNGTLIQIMSKKASKESAVLNVLAKLGLPKEAAVVFGDDHNDIGLFRACGRSYAMGNAIQELKDIASRVTETNDNDGVAAGLEQILNAERKRNALTKWKK
ncbi:HAD family hydrolase [Paenibacillus sp. S150]|uniref:HAD family hydrolase n=1 Tax=Paenibacillus sp. S150 TaxID=2749826 RepID=UPI001C58953C|nr:HAD family hydrolase [Paenibacillus sp. S150]MBW4080963.1 HAD family hydrolase [Paenibacillus sp. S150]